MQNVKYQPYPNHDSNQRPRVNILINDGAVVLPTKVFANYEAQEYMQNSFANTLLNNRKFKNRGTTTCALVKASEECFVAPATMYLQPTLTFGDQDDTWPA